MNVIGDDFLRSAVEADGYYFKLKRRQIDIRYHRDFSDERIRTIMQRLFASPEAMPLAGFAVNYQGRPLING